MNMLRELGRLKGAKDVCLEKGVVEFLLFFFQKVFDRNVILESRK